MIKDEPVFKLNHQIINQNQKKKYRIFPGTSLVYWHENSFILFAKLSKYCKVNCLHYYYYFGGAGGNKPQWIQ